MMDAPKKVSGRRVPKGTIGDHYPRVASPSRRNGPLRNADQWRPRDEGSHWSTFKDQVDVVSVAIRLLGEPDRVDGSGRSWWVCPFHEDHNPSFCVTLDRGTWKCFGCGAGGDAPALVMKRKNVDFVEAVRFLAEGIGRPTRRPGWGVCWSGRKVPQTRPTEAPFLRVNGGLPKFTGKSRPEDRSSPHDAPSPPPSTSPAPPTPSSPVTSGGGYGLTPTGLAVAEAMDLVDQSEMRLWSDEGVKYRRWLNLRGLTNATIRHARLGWVPNVSVPTRGDLRFFRATGIVIPWFDGERLRMVKIRQPTTRKPKYVEVFRDGPTMYPSPSVVKPGHPLVMVEGEFDALLLGQELKNMAAVATLGSASNGPEPVLWHVFGAGTIFVAHDADPAGDRAAAAWPPRAIRVRPPEPNKDWTDACRTGIDLTAFWRDQIKATEPPRENRS